MIPAMRWLIGFYVVPALLAGLIGTLTGHFGWGVALAATLVLLGLLLTLFVAACRQAGVQRRQQEAKRDPWLTDWEIRDGYRVPKR